MRAPAGQPARSACLALFAALLPAALAAQNIPQVALLRGQTGVDPAPNSLLATPSGLTATQLLLSDALARLSERSRVQVAFSPSLLPADQRVDCDCATLNMARALDQLLAGTELGYVELGSQVVVVPKAAPEIPRFDGTVRGRVRTEVATPIEDVTARLRLAADSTVQRVTITDRLGFFTFPDLAPADYVLSVGRIGYRVHEEEITAMPGAVVQVDVALAEEAVPVPEMQVDAASNRQRVRFRQSAGQVQEMDRAQIRSIPGAAEADPIRSVDALPGVTRVSEIGASFNVRGGSADQNLILLDGVPILNPFHMLGMFSVFNADMVKRTELRSGGFPAEYGGRASSVLHVESDLGDGDFAVDAGLSLLTSRISVAGGLSEELKDGLGLASARWRVAGRRSYLDVLTKPFAQAIGAPFPYYLRDRQAGFEAWTKGGSRLRITSYSGRDVVNLTDIERLENSSRFPTHQAQLPSDDVTWDWGNRAFGISWTRPSSGGGALDIRGSYSRFDGNFMLSEFAAPRLTTRIRQYSLSAELERRPTAKIRWKSGLAYEYLNYSSDSRGEPESLLKTEYSRGSGGALYTQVNWTPNPRWLVEGGLRLDNWQSQPELARGAIDFHAYPANGVSRIISPRFAVKRFLRDGRWAVRVVGGRYVQFLQSVRDESLPISLDPWVFAGDGGSTVAVVSDRFQGGVEGFFGGDDEWFASGEGYYRSDEGLAARNWADDPFTTSDDYVSGTGRSYGADLVLRRHKGATTGWVSVSLLKAIRRFPETGGGLDPAPMIEYAPAFDRRLEVDLVVQRQLPWGLQGGLRWNLGTGLPYTRPVPYQVHSPQITDLRLGSGREDVVWLGPKNGERYPARHRLDISLRKVIRKKWGVVTPYLNVINVYNRKNVLIYDYFYSGGRPGRGGTSTIPFLPTFGVEVSF